MTHVGISDYAAPITDMIIRDSFEEINVIDKCWDQLSSTMDSRISIYSKEIIANNNQATTKTK